jgi:tetratricopeptide (TPR) repeat protein
MASYSPESGAGAVVISVNGMSETVPYGGVCPWIVLAQCYAALGRRPEAILLLEQILAAQWNPYTALFLCSLYVRDERWSEVIRLSDGLANESDVLIRLLLYRGRALEALGDSEPAIRVYGECLRYKRERTVDLLAEARYRRAKLNLAAGRKAAARKDIDILYAADSGWAEVAALRAVAGQ